jgi:hypothetical protein
MLLTFYKYINYNKSMLKLFINWLFRKELRWEKPVEIDFYKLGLKIQKANKSK